MSHEKTGVPQYWSDEKEQLRKVSQVVNALQKGLGNASFHVELEEAPATQTEVIKPGLTSEQHAWLSPMNAAAALDYATGTTYAVVTEGMVTIHHASGAAGREYGVLLQG